MLLSFLMAMGAAVRTRITRNIAYAASPGAQLDIYAPIGADGEAPVIVVAHGGGRSGASPARYISAALSSRGFVVVTVGGRPGADAAADEQLTDLAAAIAWTTANALRFGGDPSRIFLMGHAGGAGCVAKICLEGGWLEPHGVKVGDLRGAIGISGLYDSPTAPPAGPPPPMLLIAGQNDAIDPQSTSGLARTLRTAGGPVAEIVYPKLGDGGRLRRFTGAFRFRGLVLGEVERFVRHQSLGPGA